MSDFDTANVEYEREREKWNLDPTDAPTSAKKLSISGIFVRLVIGLILFRLAIEFLSFFS